MSRHPLLLSLAFALCLNLPLAAQDTPANEPASAPATAEAGSGAMKVVVAEVKGLVQVRANDGAGWEPAKVGMELTEGAEFRTGTRSSVTCVIPPDQTIVLDRLGTVKVLEAIQQGGKIRTDLAMKYGRTNYNIQAAGVQHESTIRSPSSTLAVRGTNVSLYDQPPFAPEARSFTGRAEFRNAQRLLRLGGKGQGARIVGDQSAAATALNESVVDPSIAQARTGSENRLIANEVSKGALLNFNEQTQIATIRGGAGPQSDAELAASLPGQLNFVLRWSGNADLNLVVDEQRVAADKQIEALFTFQPEEILFPGFGLNRNATGGVIPFDHRGGPNGGQEIAYWKDSFPDGIYGLAVQHASGESATFKLNAFENGKPISIFAFGVESPLVHATTIQRTLDPGAGDEIAIVLVPPNAQLEEQFPTERPSGSLQGGAAPSSDAVKPKKGSKTPRTAKTPAKLTRAERNAASSLTSPAPAKKTR